MRHSYTERIGPYVTDALREASNARSRGQPETEFRYLERAHVLGQSSTYWHTRVHWAMGRWAFRNRAPGEFFGQLLRIAGAATKTPFGLVPEGNTGGSNVSPFKRMPIAADLRHIIETARSAG